MDVDVVSSAAVYAVGEVPSTLTAVIDLVSPLDGLVIPAKRPKFRVTITTSDDNLFLEVEYSTDEDFNDDETSMTTAPVSSGQESIEAVAQVNEELPDNMYYYWRARISDGSATTDWSVVRRMTISYSDGDAAAPAGWNVTTGTTPAPHIWFVRPPRAIVGQQATIYGTGFGLTTGKVALGDEYAEVDSWGPPEAPTALAYYGERVIDPDTGVVDPYHEEVVFTVPDDALASGVLYVETA